jgi:hypothetical protein
MANKTIPDFGPVGAIAGGDLYAIWDLSAAANRYISHADLETAIITDLASVYQPLNSKLTTFAALADAAGVLTSDGAGNYSWGAGGGSQWIDDGSDIYFSAGNVGIGIIPAASNTIHVLGNSYFDGANFTVLNGVQIGLAMDLSSTTYEFGDVNTNANGVKLSINDAAQTLNLVIDGAHGGNLQIDGVAGASATFTAITSITVTNGIITSITGT